MLNLELIRRKKGWTQKELTQRSGVSNGVICNLEKGRVYPYPGWKRKLAAALGVEESTLFDEV